MNQENNVPPQKKRAYKRSKPRKNEPVIDANETAVERVARIYSGHGGPLVTWLLEEARHRNQSYKAMAGEVGVTYAYIHQLRTGYRASEQISQDFTLGCARYLRVPPIVIKIISGQIEIADFAFPNESEEQVIDRAMKRILEDPKLRSTLPAEVSSMPVDFKRLIVNAHARTSGEDIFSLRELTGTLRLLQAAASLHVQNKLEASEKKGPVPE